MIFLSRGKCRVDRPQGRSRSMVCLLLSRGNKEDVKCAEDNSQRVLMLWDSTTDNFG